MSDRVFPWAMLASVATHVAGLGAMTALDTAPAPSLPITVPVEIVTVTPPSAKSAPEAVKPLTPPRLIEQRHLHIEPGRTSAPDPAVPALPSPAGAVRSPSLAEERLLAPPASRPRLIGEEPLRSSRVIAGPLDAPGVPGPPRVTAGVLAPSAPPSVSGGLLPVPRTSWGGLAGAGAVDAGSAGGAAGPGGTSRAGAARGAGPARGNRASGGGGGAGGGAERTGRGGMGTASDGDVTAFARPLGGYQTKPVYPDSALRAGIQGVTRLRFEVLATGRVGRVLVEESAGSGDLDRAAVEAVKSWRFEPARRGDQPVAVWVTLPVRFELRNQ